MTEILLKMFQEYLQQIDGVSRELMGLIADGAEEFDLGLNNFFIFSVVW